MRSLQVVTRAGIVAGVVLLIGSFAVHAQNQNPRFGKWKLKSDAPPPSSNIMTYAPLGANGMKITIDSVNREGEKSQWGYTTHFDGKDEKLVGNDGADTGAVRSVSDSVSEITYKKGGKVTRILTNVLSPDGDTIGVLYMSIGPDGKVTRVTSATYERIKD